MYRLEAVVFLLAALPFIMASIYASAVAPRRKQNMRISLQAAAAPPVDAAPRQQQTIDTIARGAARAEADFNSLTSLRLLLPALLLSVLYGLGFSLGLSVLLPDANHGFLLWPFTAFGPTHLLLLHGPAFAVAGAYTFNAGVLVRRAFIADFSKNVIWSCIDRFILSLGFAIFLETFHIEGIPYGTNPTSSATRNALCFAIAFFPAVFITAMRKRTRKLLGVGCETQELDIQLIQGIDVWKEERLSEEGIESVQNLATADIFGLLPKVHYPLRTIVDWMDQAIFIQRFPSAYLKWQQAGFAISAIRFAAMIDPTLLGATSQDPYNQPASMSAYAPTGADVSGRTGVVNRASATPVQSGNFQFVGQTVTTTIVAPASASVPDAALLQSMAYTAAFDPAVLREALTSLSNDAAVRVLARLWQAGILAE